MKIAVLLIAIMTGPSLALAATGSKSTEQDSASAALIFRDEFDGRLQPGWWWLRENREAWRVSARGLEIRIEPGNMWGPQNDARNILLRAAPVPATNQIEVSITVQNRPINQYEQSDLVWYLDDSNMVKLGQELVDGKLSVVMGREENDKTRTISITPLDSTQVRLRLRVSRDQIRGAFRTPAMKEWMEVGACEPPRTATTNRLPQIALQCYQGAPAGTNWARLTDFYVANIR